MYHIIFVCNCRKFILKPISEEIKQIMIDISRGSNFEVLEMETDKDYIHFLIKSEPKVSAFSIIMKLKQDLLTECGKHKRNIWKSIIGVKIH